MVILDRSLKKLTIFYFSCFVIIDLCLVQVPSTEWKKKERKKHLKIIEKSRYRQNDTHTHTHTLTHSLTHTHAYACTHTHLPFLSLKEETKEKENVDMAYFS